MCIQFLLLLLYMTVDDFNDTSVRVTVNPGETMATVSIMIIDDDLLEGVELFDVEISIEGTDTAGAELRQPGILSITILNEDSMSHTCLPYVPYDLIAF